MLHSSIVTYLFKCDVSMTMGNHLELKCLDDCLWPLKPKIEAKVCVLFLILGILMVLPWIALFMTYDDDDFICCEECIRNYGLMSIYWFDTMSGNFLAVY